MSTTTHCPYVPRCWLQLHANLILTTILGETAVITPNDTGEKIKAREDTNLPEIAETVSLGV